MTYAELLQSWQDWLESSETTLVGEFDTIVEMAETRIYRAVDLNEARMYQTAALTIGDEFITLPADCVVIRSGQIIDADTNNRTTLIQKDISFLDEFVLNRTNTGTPKYFAWYDDSTIIVAPSPDAVDTIELQYTIRPTQLSTENTETWLSLEAPDLMLNACLLEGAVFNRMEGPDLQMYLTRYQESLQGLLMEENFRNRQSEDRFRTIKVGG